jgi:hypothetical protein
VIGGRIPVSDVIGLLGLSQTAQKRVTIFKFFEISPRNISKGGVGTHFELQVFAL